MSSKKAAKRKAAKRKKKEEDERAAQNRAAATRAAPPLPRWALHSVRAFAALLLYTTGESDNGGLEELKRFKAAELVFEAMPQSILQCAHSALSGLSLTYAPV